MATSIFTPPVVTGATQEEVNAAQRQSAVAPRRYGSPFDLYMAREMAKGGGMQSKGKGWVFARGPYKGKTKGEAEEDATNKWKTSPQLQQEFDVAAGGGLRTQGEAYRDENYKREAAAALNGGDGKQAGGSGIKPPQADGSPFGTTSDFSRSYAPPSTGSSPSLAVGSTSAGLPAPVASAAPPTGIHPPLGGFSGDGMGGLRQAPSRGDGMGSIGGSTPNFIKRSPEEIGSGWSAKKAGMMGAAGALPAPVAPISSTREPGRVSQPLPTTPVGDGRVSIKIPQEYGGGVGYGGASPIPAPSSPPKVPTTTPQEPGKPSPVNPNGLQPVPDKYTEAVRKEKEAARQAMRQTSRAFMDRRPIRRATS